MQDNVHTFTAATELADVFQTLGVSTNKKSANAPTEEYVGRETENIREDMVEAGQLSLKTIKLLIAEVHDAQQAGADRKAVHEIIANFELTSENAPWVSRRSTGFRLKPGYGKKNEGILGKANVGYFNREQLSFLAETIEKIGNLVEDGSFDHSISAWLTTKQEYAAKGAASRQAQKKEAA